MVVVVAYIIIMDRFRRQQQHPPHPAGSLDALFEEELQAVRPLLHARGIVDKETALRYTRHLLANRYARDVENKIKTCIAKHADSEYSADAESLLYAAFAKYVKFVGLCIPDRHLHDYSNSALAAIHRAIPQDERDDEWHAIDVVLRARENARHVERYGPPPPPHGYYPYPYQHHR